MELAAQDARPVPREASRKQVSSKGTGAMAKPADAVLTTRAAMQVSTDQSINKKPSLYITPELWFSNPEKTLAQINFLLSLWFTVAPGIGYN